MRAAQLQELRMSTTEILRVYGRKLPAVVLALGLMAAPRAQALEKAGQVASPAARAVKRAAATKLAKAKKHKKKAADADASADSADTAEDGGGTADDKEASLLASPRSKAARGDDDDGASAPPRKKPARYVEDGSSSTTASSDDDADSKADRPKVVKRAPAPVKEEEPAEGPAQAGTALEVGLGGMALFRQLAWTSDGAAAGLGPYKLLPGPEAGLWLEFYPAAFVTTGFASNIGLYARYAYGFGVTSTLQSGTQAATSYQDFVAGLKVRIPLGTFTPYGMVAYGEQQFSIAPQGNTADLPAMDYSFVRIGAGTRIQLTPMVGLDASLAFLTVTNAGSGVNQLASQSYFPQTTAYAAEGGASLAIRLTSKVGVRLGADIRQYGISLNPQSGGKQVTGAVDRYMVAWSGLEVLLDGLGAASDDEPAPAPKHARKHRSADDDSSDDDSSKSDSDDKPSKSSKSSDDE
jgi:hypothetical protein